MATIEERLALLEQKLASTQQQPVRFWQGMNKADAVEFLDKIMVGVNQDGSTKYTDINKIAALVNASGGSGVEAPPVPNSVLPDLGIGNKITFLDAGTYKQPDGVTDLVVPADKLVVGFWDGAVWSAPIEMDLPAANNKILPWTGATPAGEQRLHNSQIWKAKVATLNEDIPGVSGKWFPELDFAKTGDVSDSIAVSNKMFDVASVGFTGSEIYPISQANWYDLNDIFSGWGAIIGVQNNFSVIQFKTRARAEMITSIYWEVRKNNKSGELLKSGTKFINLLPGIDTDVFVSFDAEIVNDLNDVLWFGYQCNQLCDRFGKAETGSFSTAYSKNGLQDDSMWLDSQDRDNWIKYGIFSKEVTPSVKLLNDIKAGIPEINEFPETKNKTDLAIEIIDTFIGSDIFPEESAEAISLTGGFSGWLTPIGIQKNFNVLQGKIIALSQPITSINYELRENSKDGFLLASGNISVNIQPNTSQVIDFDLGDIITNPNDSQLLFGYKCNVNAGLFGNSGESFPFPAYPKASYTTSINGPWMLVDGSGTRNAWYKVGIKKDVASPMPDFTEEIKRKLNIINPEVIEVSLPDKIYAIVGDTLQLFWRGIIKAVNPYVYDIVVNCTKGAWYPRYFEYTPAIEDIGTTVFEVKVKNSSGVVIASKTCSLITRNAITSPMTLIKALPVGDSLTNARIWPVEASRRLTGSGGVPVGKEFNNIEFVGRKKDSEGVVGAEGNSGWSWNDYLTAGRRAFTFTVSDIVSQPLIEDWYEDANGNIYTMWWDYSSTSFKFLVNDMISTPPANGVLTRLSGNGDEIINYSNAILSGGNPLWNDITGELDFTGYVNKWCGGSIDVMYFLLTWNAQYGTRTDFSAFTNAAKILFSHCKAAYPNLKIKLMGVQVPDLKGGVRVDGSPAENTYTDTYGLVVTALNMNEAYQALANDPIYSSYVEFVNVSSQVDSEYNMPFVQKAVNTRNNDFSEPIGTNDVHPNGLGYLQIGDIVYRNFIANYCQ